MAETDPTVPAADQTPPENTIPATDPNQPPRPRRNGGKNHPPTRPANGGRRSYVPPHDPDDDQEPSRWGRGWNWSVDHRKWFIVPILAVAIIILVLILLPYVTAGIRWTGEQMSRSWNLPSKTRPSVETPAGQSSQSGVLTKSDVIEGVKEGMKPTNDRLDNVIGKLEKTAPSTPAGQTVGNTGLTKADIADGVQQGMEQTNRKLDKIEGQIGGVKGAVDGTTAAINNIDLSKVPIVTAQELYEAGRRNDFNPPTLQPTTQENLLRPATDASSGIPGATVAPAGMVFDALELYPNGEPYRLFRDIPWYKIDGDTTWFMPRGNDQPEIVTGAGVLFSDPHPLGLPPRGKRQAIILDRTAVLGQEAKVNIPEQNLFSRMVDGVMTWYYSCDGGVTFKRYQGPITWTEAPFGLKNQAAPLAAEPQSYGNQGMPEVRSRQTKFH